MKPRLLLMLLTAVLAGCAARTLPARFPTASPASRQSAEAPKARVVTTLQSDPPLPGTPDGDWRGLEQPPPSSKHAHQEH
jgi:hypothetical protein